MTIRTAMQARSMTNPLTQARNIKDLVRRDEGGHRHLAGHDDDGREGSGGVGHGDGP